MPGPQTTRPVSWPARDDQLAAVLAVEAVGPMPRSGTALKIDQWTEAYEKTHAAIVKTLSAL